MRRLLSRVPGHAVTPTRPLPDRVVSAAVTGVLFALFFGIDLARDAHGTLSGLRAGAAVARDGRLRRCPACPHRRLDPPRSTR